MTRAGERREHLAQRRYAPGQADMDFVHQTIHGGGATREIGTEKEPKKGWMVGGAGGLPEENHILHRLTGTRVVDHANKVLDAGGTHQGSWREERNGESYAVLDSVTVHHSLNEAMKVGIARSQRSIYSPEGGGKYVELPEGVKTAIREAK